MNLDELWIVFSGLLVLLMVCGLALFYTGMTTSKNAINTMKMSFIALGLIPVLWLTIGYSLAFFFLQDKKIMAA